ncbi:MAG: NAD(P)H-dependent glycerol-3-phosphate dehydrogenase [Pseudomonadota bacterium]
MTEPAMNHVGVVGMGAWGTALAQSAARAGCDVVLLGRNADLAKTILTSGENSEYLPGISLAKTILATSDASRLSDCNAVLLVVPAQALRSVLSSVRDHLPAEAPLILCAKGLEQGTHKLMSDVATEIVPETPLAVLSGPSFASDVARGLPTAVTLACRDDALGNTLVRALGHATFRPYQTADVVGTEIGGAVKNVLAIACGIVSGRKLGASAGAALTARGFAELTRFGVALGARPETLSGLSGLGDLILTATSPQSRNFSLGVDIGSGVPIGEILAERRALSEGMWTASALVARAASLGVDMPISAAVAEIVADRMSVNDAIEALLSRPFKREG